MAFPRYPPILVHQEEGYTTSSGAQRTRIVLRYIGTRVEGPDQQKQPTHDGGHMAVDEIIGNGASSPNSSDEESDTETAARLAPSNTHRHMLFVSQREAVGNDGIQKLAIFLSVTDFVTVLYGILSAPWERYFSIGVLVGLVVSNALFMWAARVTSTVWAATLVMVLLPLNCAVVYSVNTPDILLARLLIVLGEMVLLARARSLIEETVYVL